MKKIIAVVTFCVLGVVNNSFAQELPCGNPGVRGESVVVTPAEEMPLTAPVLRYTYRVADTVEGLDTAAVTNLGKPELDENGSFVANVVLSTTKVSFVVFTAVGTGGESAFSNVITFQPTVGDPCEAPEAPAVTLP